MKPVNETERYLKRATQGLFGRRKAEVRAELEEHLLERAWAYEVRGHTKDEALSLALGALGRPQAVSAGMNGVYTMPNLIRSTFLVAALAGTAVVLLSTSTAQVEAISRPSDPPNYFSYLSLSSLKAGLEAAGVTVDDSPRPPESPAPGSPTAGGALGPALSFTLPGASRRVEVRSGAGITIPGVSGWNPPLGPEAAPVGARPGETYVQDAYALSKLAQSGLPVTLEGWYNPRVSVGRIALVLGTQKRPVSAYPLYGSQAFHTLSRNPDLAAMRAYGLARWTTPSQRGALLPFHRHAVRVGAPAGTVYAVATSAGINAPTASGGLAGFMALVDVARVSDRGVLELLLPWRAVEFSENPAALAADHEAIKAKGLDKDIVFDMASLEKAAFPGRHPHAVLLRLNGRFGPEAPGAEIVVPSRPRSAALN